MNITQGNLKKTGLGTEQTEQILSGSGKIEMIKINLLPRKNSAYCDLWLYDSLHKYLE